MSELADSYDDAGRRDEALKLREEVVTLRHRALEIHVQKDPNSRASADAYDQLGFSLGAAGRGDDAIKAWQEAVRIDPLHRRNSHYWLGKALVDRQRYAEALPVLRATQTFYPDGDRGRETALRLALAESAAGTGSPPAGAPTREACTAWLTALREAVAANPADTDRAKHLATVHLWLGETNEHRALCRKLLELAANSKDPTAHDRAAKAYLLQAHPDSETLKQAVAAGRQALNLASPNDPNRGWFLVTTALAAIRDGAPVEAEPLLTEALSVPGGHRDMRGLALACRAMARAQLDQTNEARADFAELEKIRPVVPAPPTPSGILLEAGAMAVALLYEEAKALLNGPSVAKP